MRDHRVLEFREAKVSAGPYPVVRNAGGRFVKI